MSVEGPGPQPAYGEGPPPPPVIHRGGFWKGFGLGFLLHLAQILAFAQPFLLTLWGLTQFAYMIPAALHFRKKGEPDTVKGLVTAAALSFVLNAACWGLFFGMASNWR